ncbi:hypothetical protein ACHAQA_006935 [Verticillium albo-atrum]
MDHTWSTIHRTFVDRNSFTGRPPAYLPDLPPLLNSTSPLLPALHALAFLQLRRPRPALEAYGTAITALRTTLSAPAHGAGSLSPSAPPRTTVLWTTFFLGLFELMTDASGAGWVQHMVHGTARALIAGGPGPCRADGDARRFFLQVRAFEVCRAVIFNEVSFLGDAAWRGVGRGETEEDGVLDAIVLCSGLRVRTGEFIEGLEGLPTPLDRMTALSLAEEGSRLRDALDAAPTGSLLARLLVAATSIYLSGNYDYDLPAWRTLEIEVPILPAETVAAHWSVIVSCAREALRERTLSPLLLLYPLRVAGARAWTAEEQRVIDGLLSEVGSEFIVAEAFLGELREVWRERNDAASRFAHDEVVV